MKIVFLAHYFPPLNSSGARRIQSFARYLSLMGHHITVITTTKSRRDGLLTEALPDYVDLCELNGLGRISASPELQSLSKGVNNAVVSNRSLLGGLLLKIKRAIARTTGQLVDHRLIFAFQFIYPWLDQSIKQKIKGADIVMSTSPPWPVHLAGYIIKKRFSKPWVADYRDQFSGSHIQAGSPWFQRREADLERWFLDAADAVVTISGPMKEYYERFHSSVFCIENGYEEALFEKNIALSNKDESSTGEIVIRYLGTITQDRIPLSFFSALLKVNSKPGRRIVAEFYGDSSLLVKALAKEVPEVRPFIKIHQQLPYADAIASMQNADALFFIETSNFSSHSSRGVLTTKLFEYLAARRPIIAEINEKALAASYIQRAGAGLVISEDANEIGLALLRLRGGDLNLPWNELFVHGLSRRLKATELENVLQGILNRNSEVRPA